MHGGDEHDVVTALVRNRPPSNIQGLGINLTIDGQGKAFPKLSRLHRGRCQHGFRQIGVYSDDVDHSV